MNTPAPASSLRLFTRAPVEAPGALVPTIAFLALSTFVPSRAEDIVARGFWFWAWPVAGQGVRYVAFAAGNQALGETRRLRGHRRPPARGGTAAAALRHEPAKGAGGHAAVAAMISPELNRLCRTRGKTWISRT